MRTSMLYVPMKYFEKHSFRRYVALSSVSVICTLLAFTSLHAMSVIHGHRRVHQVHQPEPTTPQSQPEPIPTQSLPSTSAGGITDVARDWRPTNRVPLESNSGVAQRLKKLAEQQTPADHPDTVRLARDLLNPPPDNLDGIKHARYIMKTPQAEKVDEITRNMRNGFFVECGALDGERSSNTLYLERERGWTGLLVEMDPYFYTQLLGKNRNVWSINACLSPYKYVTTLQFQGDDSGAGRLLMQKVSWPMATLQKHRQVANMAPCFPLETLLLAINVSRVDYFSLDVEGVELPILRTIPWSRLDIRVMSVEYGHGPGGKAPYLEFVKSIGGYSVYADIHVGNYEKALFVEDFIFVKNSTV